MRHLNHEPKTNVFLPDNSFANVDARLLGPIASFVLPPTKLYLERYFSSIPEIKWVLERIEDIKNRIFKADAVHEKLMAAKG